MGRIIRCECGETVRGEDDQEVLAAAHEHIEAKHPDMVTTINDSQLMAMAEDD
jgi:predicted small metal-binding protein